MDAIGRDKNVELQRYDARAAGVVAGGDLAVLGPDGADGIPIEIRAPYVAYESRIREIASKHVRVLDLCCGNGQHSVKTAATGAELTVADIAPRNVEIAVSRCASKGLSVKGVVADAEHLPFERGSFELVTCAGSLSYVDLRQFLSEIQRVLAPGGTFICVDSLNHNPVYRMNRRIHYWRGERSESVILRTPTKRTIKSLIEAFPSDATVSFHGIFSFMVPLLRPLVGAARTARFLDNLDKKFSRFERFSFKFVFKGSAP